MATLPLAAPSPDFAVFSGDRGLAAASYALNGDLVLSVSDAAGYRSKLVDVFSPEYRQARQAADMIAAAERGR